MPPFLETSIISGIVHMLSIQIMPPRNKVLSISTVSSSAMLSFYQGQLISSVVRVSLVHDV